MARRIEAGPYWLTCGHCKAEFEGTWHQFKHWKYEGSKPFCSTICRTTWISDSKRKPKPQYGPCPTCGIMFESRVPKRFCSMKCYVASPEHPGTTGSGTEASRRKRLSLPDDVRYNRDHRNCLECGADFEVQPAKTKKFCSHACYRKYMAKRFDRWIASPQRIALPQAYDEFLASEELPCLVDGCDWVGHHLSGHMNLAHGVTAEEFKRAAGFNVTSGIVSMPLHETLVARAVDYRGFGLAALAAVDRAIAGAASKRIRRYRSLEGAEHHQKARALADKGPVRVCKGCGTEFRQSSPFGRTKFCTIECRDNTYAQRLGQKVHPMRCSECGKKFRGTSYQLRRHERNEDVCCSIDCRGKRNIRFALASREGKAR